MRSISCTAPLFLAAIFLTGCGFDASRPAAIAPLVIGMHGKLMGGQQPIAGSLVTVLAIGRGAPPTPLASTTTDASGNFQFGTTIGNSYTCPSAPLAAASPNAHPVPASAPKLPQPNSSSITNATYEPAQTSRAHPAVLPDTSDTYVYITAEGGDAGGGPNSSILLAAGLGKCTDAQSATVEINEVTTVVFAMAMANGYTGYHAEMASTADPDAINAIDIADTQTFQTIIDLPTGTIKPNTVSATGTSITIEAAKIYSLANTIAACVNSADDTSVTPAAPSSTCQEMFDDATLYFTPVETFDTIFSISEAPFNNVIPLYKLAGSKPPFPSLPTAPNDWTIGISYSTPAMGLGLFPDVNGKPTSSNIDIDSSGRVWFPSNKSGAIGIGYFDPTTNSFGGPFANSAVKRPQYIALDDSLQQAWASDSTSLHLFGVDTAPGAEGNSEGGFFFSGVRHAYIPHMGPLLFTADDYILSTDLSGNGYGSLVFAVLGPNGYGDILSSFKSFPTGITIDTVDGTDPNDDQNPNVVAVTSDGSKPCSLELSSTNDGQSTLFTDADNCSSGGIATTTYFGPGLQDSLAVLSSENAFCSKVNGTCTALPQYLSSPQGIAVDGGNEAWIANSSNASVYALYGSNIIFTPGSLDYVYTDRPYLHGVDNGGTMTAPVGIAVDRLGNVWASNANCTSTTDSTCVYTLSEILGVGQRTYTPLADAAARKQGTLPGYLPYPDGNQTVHSDIRSTLEKSHALSDNFQHKR